MFGPHIIYFLNILPPEKNVILYIHHFDTAFPMYAHLQQLISIFIITVYQATTVMILHHSHMESLSLNDQYVLHICIDNCIICFICWEKCQNQTLLRLLHLCVGKSFYELNYIW